MNNNLKELYYKAHNTSDVEGSFPQYFSASKFAELIIRECIEIVQPEAYEGDAMTASLNAKVKQIKEHFGIEK